MSDDEAEAPVVSIIAQPLADAKLTKKVLKVVKKGEAAHQLRETALSDTALARRLADTHTQAR
jgi:hypothetical protein